MRITVLEIDIYMHSSLIHGFHMESQGISDKVEPLFFFLVLEKKCLGYHYLNSFPSGGRVYNLLMVFHCTFAGSPDSQSTNRRN